ncbi:hypothetical protein ACHAWX_005273 [Stephanocyclus meneghinianus]
MMHPIKFILLFLFQSINASVDTSENNAVEVNAKIGIPHVDGNCLRSKRLDAREVASKGNLIKRRKPISFNTTPKNEKESQDKLNQKTKDDNWNQKEVDKKEVTMQTLETKDKDILASTEEPAKLKKKKKKKKKLKKKDKKENITKNEKKTDNRAIRIRNKCKTPLNIYRTCYDRALDPSNDLENDELQLLTPFAAPFIDRDEWLVSDSMYLVITEFSSDISTLEKCSSFLHFEELTLKYLKDNIGNEDTFTPLCVFIGNGMSDGTHTNGITSAKKTVKTELGETVDVSSVAMKAFVVFAFKKKFASEIKTTFPRVRSLMQTPRFLPRLSCSTSGFALCCSGGSINSRGAPRSAQCRGGCGSRNCQKKKKKPKKIIKRELSETRDLPDLFDMAFDNVVSSYTEYKPVETRAIIGAEIAQNVATCAVNRYVQDTLRSQLSLKGQRSFHCGTYFNSRCSRNEDIIPETDETRQFCASRDEMTSSTITPTFSPSPTVNPTTQKPTLVRFLSLSSHSHQQS